MRRLYITTLDTALEGHGVKQSDWNQINHSIFHPSVGWHAIHLINYTDPAHVEMMHLDNAAWQQLPEVRDWVAAGKPILMSTSLDHSEANEDRWHEHPDVAILPHPTLEGNVAIGDTNQDSPKAKSAAGKPFQYALKKVKQKHINALKNCKQLGFSESDTVLDLSVKARKMNPEVKIKYPV